MPNPYELLHTPGCIGTMDLGGHLAASSALARALWLLIQNGDEIVPDPRDRAALLELASDVANHTSATLELYTADS